MLFLVGRCHSAFPWQVPDYWTLTPGCSFFVLDRAVSWARVGGTMREDRLVRLLDLEPYEVVIVNCQCGRSVEYPNGLLQRRHRQIGRASWREIVWQYVYGSGGAGS